MVRHMMFFALLASAGAAQAGDKPLYAPAPDWVKPAPPIDTSKIKDDTPIFLIMDSQQRLQGDEVTVYAETAARVASTQVLDSLGTVTLPWQPDKGDLIIHTAEIVRGNERIDLLKTGERFSVLRREAQLEQRMLNGLLTATMPVEGLRVGDVLHLRYSTTQKDAALKGEVQAFAQLAADPFRADFGRVRMIWPVNRDVKWKADAAGVTPVVTKAGGFSDLTITVPLAKQPEMPGDSPSRYRHLPLLEATSFTDWAGVSRVMAPLYDTTGLIVAGSPLAGEVAKIAAATPDPVKRAALALELVQDKVRYLFKGMDGGNYVPQTPTQTWTVRYGDCKAKTLLLLAMLRGLGIEAEAVLANSQFGDWVPQRLPSPGAFDHVLVRATIGADSLWLDGTGSGSLLADIRDIPPFRNVLPLKAAGSGLIAVPLSFNSRPDFATTLTRDESAGVGFPAPFTLAITFRGQLAQVLRAAQGQMSKDQLAGMAAKLGETYVGSSTNVSRALVFDPAAGTATMTIAGVTYPNWDRENERYRTTMDFGLKSMKLEADRSRVAWRDIPLSTGEKANIVLHAKVRLPDGGKGFAMEGNPKLSAILAGGQVDRTATLADGWVTSDIAIKTDGGEIAAADIPAARQKLAQTKQQLIRLVAPANYPAPWEVVRAGKPAHRFDAILSVYKAGIADQPEKAEPFTNRAWFLERIYEWRPAIDDIGRAIAIDPTADSHLWRGRLYWSIGEMDKALADMLEARKIDPASDSVIQRLAFLYGDRKEYDKGLAMLDARIEEGGKDKASFMIGKAELLGLSGRTDDALMTIDAAIASKPGDPDLLNSRCWLKGTMNVMLDTALKDCTKAIALADSAEKVLDSRALVYFRMGQMDDALSDLNAALEQDPSLSASLFMRGVIRKKQGDAKNAEVDLAAARLIRPSVDRDYARFGIAP
ncbi:tetratricopeptide repeat protein [Sphingomonas aliaeris]|uniref:Tetratricopeptide repeat protein n=1 Tax=Sphingomonas aliaeris TaxID=2759526 RepID=A0A974S562_9SPHN|nr:DUF3857 domain-containing protein [Sphingomonas aliaeris]QQV78116.1 tetratricopeptide repeat protein [Sphingomonas aliaeris]